MSRSFAITLLATLLFLGMCSMLRIPRFIEAQTRSKVSRTWGVLREAATRLRGLQSDASFLLEATANGSPTNATWEGVADPLTVGGADPIRCFAGKDRAWILAGVGPDQDRDMSPEDWMFTPTAERDARWLAMRYDPTNGTISNGDILLASWEPPGK